MAKKSITKIVNVGPDGELYVSSHKDVAIYLDTNYGKFEMLLDPRFEGKRYDSVMQAQAAIDRELTAEAKVKLNEYKIELPVLTYEGVNATVTGINRSDGSVLFKEKGISGSNIVYPVEKWVLQALLRRAEIQKELRTLDRKLDPVGVSVSRYGGRVAAEFYGERIEALKGNLASAAKRAAQDK